ncbi:hypothetical protein ASG11_04170 [Sphingomonas sp. Leaf357]|uniref:DUF1134 domain-containing protein n=1 Tax=Sphingomonas sp. Leaf357 TaxID=1736350 RepID=UPI0006F75F24|nr:DUF1134 domain-containing protein [Sphingomonas sp. Leaf357]KQS03549.1 hypothetical protein ASG11_04170 [Sphingomonas sp. Leaf357]
MKMRKVVSTLLLAALMLGTGPAIAQDSVRTIDPNQAIDGDLGRPQGRTPAPTYPAPAQTQLPIPNPPPAYPAYSQSTTPAQVPAQQQDAARDGANAVAASSQTFDRPELLAAAEGVFGKGTAGLAGMLEKILKDQGQPNAYVAGREAGGAFVVGLRYGSGQMFHKIEGEQPVYWTGPSVGFDVGGDASKVFVLVYNLYDTEELYKGRFAAGEGRLFFIGGFAATYLRKGDKVVIPIRLGVGWRQGVNLGYMKFSHKSNWFPL